MRTFEDVINEWTEAMVAENQKADNVETVVLITRLGMLGQRLIYEANNIGMKQSADYAVKEILKNVPTTPISE